MSSRILFNYTETDLILSDLGDTTIPANGSLEIGGDEAQLMKLAVSDDLLDALSIGIDSYQLNNGLRNLSKSEAIDLIRKIQTPTEIDNLGRWVVRVDSRKADWDTVFQGAGDDCENNLIGEGNPFMFDFSADETDLRWDNENAPSGYKMQTVDWKFCDYTFIKEGTLYYYNMPKGSYMDFYLISPPGTGYSKRILDDNLEVIREDIVNIDKWIVFQHWVIGYRIEGSVPMGDELNTESAADIAAPSFVVWRASVCVPEDDNEEWKSAHGHWSLEIYRMSMGQTGYAETTESKMI